MRHLWLSLDPYMRGPHERPASPMPQPVDIGEVMAGGTVGEVVALAPSRFRRGRHRGSVYGGWQDYAVSERRRR